MSELMDIIKKRRSVRDYLDRDVEDKKIEMKEILFWNKYGGRYKND